MNIKFQDLITLLSRGILNRKFQHLEPLDFGHENGLYIGCPGKELYFYLKNNNNEKELELISDVVCDLFPEERVRSTNLTAFLRYSYGMWNKNGCLLSEDQKQQLIQQKPDFSLTHRFVDLLLSKMELKNKCYGVIITKEIKAHRLADEAIINKNKKLFKRAINIYDWCIEESLKRNIIKNICSGKYWASRYMLEFGKNDEKAIEYAISFLNDIVKYNCPRNGYNSKVCYLFAAIKLKPSVLNLFMDKFVAFKDTQINRIDFEKYGLKNPFVN